MKKIALIIYILTITQVVCSQDNKGLVFPMIKSFTAAEVIIEDKDIRVLPSYHGCVQGDCENGEGIYLVTVNKELFMSEETKDAFSKIRRTKQTAKVDKSIEFDRKFSKTSFRDKKKRASIREKERKELSKEKYNLSSADKLTEVYQVETWIKVYKGHFSNKGAFIKGELFEFPIMYKPNEGVWEPNREVNVLEELDSFIKFKGQFTRYISDYDPVGLIRDYRAERDPSIDYFEAYYNRGSRVFVNVKYNESSSLKSFFGTLALEDDAYKTGPVFGRMESRDGTVYTGAFDNGMYQGVGVLKDSLGVLHSGFWLENELDVESEINLPEFYENQTLEGVNVQNIEMRSAGYLEMLDRTNFIGKLIGGLEDGPVVAWRGTGSALNLVVAEKKNGKLTNYGFNYNKSYESAGIQGDFDRTELQSGIRLGPDEFKVLEFRKSGYTTSKDWRMFSPLYPYRLANFTSVSAPKEDVPTFTLRFLNQKRGCFERWESSGRRRNRIGNFPKGWTIKGDGTDPYYQKWEGDRIISWSGISKYGVTLSIDHVKDLIDDNSFCSPLMTQEKKQSVIDFEMGEYARDKAYADLVKANNEARTAGMLGCARPVIKMNVSNPSLTRLECNGKIESGVEKAPSQIFWGDVIQHNGVMYEVISQKRGGLILAGGIEVFASSFYTFKGLEHAKNELRDPCPVCSGGGKVRSLLTRVSEVPAGGSPVTVYENSVVKMVRYPTKKVSHSISINTDCSRCSGHGGWPSAYARGQ